MTDWPKSLLHDAGLVSVELDWVAGTMRMEFIPHESYPDQPSHVEARGLQRAELPRTNAWGPSNSVLEAREPTVGTDGLKHLKLTMQSGDELIVIAEDFALNRVQ